MLVGVLPTFGKESTRPLGSSLKSSEFSASSLGLVCFKGLGLRACVFKGFRV